MISKLPRLLIFAGACLAAGASAAEPEPPATAEGAQELGTVNVSGNRYKPLRTDIPFEAMQWLGYKIGIPPFGANLMGPVVVTAARVPQAAERTANSAFVFNDVALQRTPAATLDGLLRSVPGFSLFRRSDSLTANPTAQGVSLRGLGPSGASRSLVLLDGVPLNDPFGGWVSWTKVPRETVARVEVVPGGGATAWGNAALGGAVQIFTDSIRTELVAVDQPPAPVTWGYRGTAKFALILGDFDTRSGEFAVTRPVGPGVLQILGQDFSTDGFSLVAPERRGPIDTAAWSRHRWLTLRWRQALNKTTEFTVTARGYEELRSNGTPYQRNGSREKFASLAMAGKPSEDFSWNAVAYAQDQSFASTFSAVNAARTVETPASDQYAVPATAFGAAWTGSWAHKNNGSTNLGFDARFVRGETRENFTFTNGAFTRQRVAGGEQAVGGLFVLHEQRIAADLRATVGARVDRWSDTEGHRRETDRNTGAVLRDDHYADRDGTEFSPSFGLVWTPLKELRVRAAAQQAFRRPTLNELYRPFRQGANVTEANPALETERALSGEIGVEWSQGNPNAPLDATRGAPLNAKKNASPPPAPTRGFSASATFFWNELNDAVGNVTLARGPGTFPLFGTLGAGGIGRQRLNLDRTQVRGLELSTLWRTNDRFSFNAAAIFNDAEVRRASIAPALVGKRIAQVPRMSASFGATWLAPAGIVLTPRVRWIGRQFEDDENTLRLGEVVVADLGLSRKLTANLELFFTLENLGNARIETGRSADGVVNTGTPRLLLGGLRGRW
jgi:outer membrane receptor protein involved in Fe transport